MKRLFSYMKDYKLESILGPLFKMLEASFELFVPLVVARMVDVGIRGRDSGYILKMGGVLVLLALIGLACSLTAQYFAAKAATGAATSLRNDLFSHIGRLSYTEIDTVGTAALITRMTSDINQVQSGINMTLRLLLRSPLWYLAPWSWPLPWTCARPLFSQSPYRCSAWWCSASWQSACRSINPCRDSWTRCC